MANLTVVIDQEAIRSQLLKSGAVGDLCEQLAAGIASKCGVGYKTDRYTGRNRINVSVYTDSAKAAEDNAFNNTMLRNMHND